MDNISILQKLKPVDFDAGIIFSGKATGTKVMGFAKASPFTPKINNNYIFHEASRDVIVWLIAPPSPLYVCGVAGAGKSSLINQLAAKLNYPVFEVTGHNRLEFQDLAGHHSIQNGNMKFDYGPLALAMKYGGLFLINELDLLDPSTATGFNSILDGQPLCIPENGGEIIQAHPMFRFVATANTNGASDETGLYQGTLRMNLALMDRFTVLEVTYPKEDAELKILEKAVPALPAKLRKKMVAYANEVRRLFMGENENASGRIEITFSTRTLLRWADLAIRYQPLAAQGIQPLSYALDRALAFRASRETRAMLHELAQRIFSLEKMADDSDMSAQMIQKAGAHPLSKKIIEQSLKPLIKEAAQGALAFEPQIVLESPANSGGKFWKGRASLTGLDLSWGRIGSRAYSKAIPSSQCAHNNPVRELMDRCLNKLAKGYDIVPAETLLP